MSEAAALLPADGPDHDGASPARPNLRRIGGEMFNWTDGDPRRGPARPRGGLLRHLIRTHAGATALVAGPHDDALITTLTDGGARVTWLLRSLRDAEEAAEAHPAVTVLAGSAVKLDPAGRFDLVVAADGVDRLNSSEGEQMSAAELIDRLAAAVDTGGVLLLVHDNPLGVHQTVRLEPGAQERDDSAWYPPDDHDPHRPASRDQLTARLAEAGLPASVTYAAFPEPAEPTVLVGPGLLDDVTAPLRPRLGVALSQAFAAAFRGRPVLSDPRVLVHRALRAGAEGTTAPAWLILAGPTNPASLLIGDSGSNFVYAPAEGVLEPLDVVERAGLRRIAATEAPTGGYVLEERLVHLCATADLRELRTELGRYESWLGEQPEDGPAVLATLADVLVTPDGPALLPTRWTPIDAVPRETALVRAFWEFGVELITAGRPHPWPITSSADELTAILLGMVGRGVPEGSVRAAVELRIRVETAEHGLTLEEQQERENQLRAVTPGTGPIDVAGYRELSEALWRQRYEASHLLATMAWTERIIGARDHELSKMDREIQYYRGKLAGKVLVVAKEAYRVVARDGRKFVRRGLKK